MHTVTATSGQDGLPLVQYGMFDRRLMNDSSIYLVCFKLTTLLHDGLSDLRDNHLICFTDMMYSSMVPSYQSCQLEILSTGQNYYVFLGP